MSFIYPRTITITRPVPQLSPAGGLASAGSSQVGGSTPYLGVRNKAKGAETIVAVGIPCSIQAHGARAVTDREAMPSSAPGPVRWKFLVPLGELVFGQVRDRDIVTDDLGNRYDIASDYWNSLGYNFEAVRLEE